MCGGKATESSFSRPAGLERFQELIDQLDLLVTWFQLLIFQKRLRGSRDVGQAVIDQREIVVNQGKVGLDLRGRFVMQARQRKVAGIVIEISKVVMRFDMARVILQRLREIFQCTDGVSSV